jgi:hypothetical protein
MAGPTVRLGLAALNTPAGLQQDARRAFLTALATVTPEVTEALSELLAVPGWNLGLDQGVFTSSPPADLRQLPGGEYAELPTGEHGEALLRWGKRYHLLAPWLLETAHRTVQRWELAGGYDPGDPWPWWGLAASAGAVPLTPDESSVTVEYSPFVEHRDSVEARIKRELDAIEALARERGWQGPIVRPAWHFEALALWNCRGLDAAEILRYRGKRRLAAQQGPLRAVRSAVSGVAALLPLPRRHGHPGRRRIT